MFFSFFKKTALQLAKIGGKKFLAALKKFITDSRLINEIHDRADKDLFLAAASSEEYRHIADIKERNIYDTVDLTDYVEMCDYNKIEINKSSQEYKEIYEKYHQEKKENIYEWYKNRLGQLYKD